jgi:hypothetical protein
MKRMLLPIFSALWFCAPAQITITAATFPSALDTLRIAVDDEPLSTIIANTGPGGPQTWDFSSLSMVNSNTIVYRPASAGTNASSFPGADLVVITGGGETYFDKTATRLDVLGFAGQFAGGFGANVVGRYVPPQIDRRAPMNFFDINQSQSALAFAFGTNQIPDTVFGGFPAPDSIRIRINSSRLDVVDAFGTCILPMGSSYEVLREKRTDISNTGIDIFIRNPFPLGWVDLTSLFPGGGPFGGLIGLDTTVGYYFFSNTEKEPIAVANYDATGTQLLSVQFKDNATTSVTGGPSAPGKANVQASPNPAIDWVHFNCSNLPGSDYTLKIFDIVGNVIWKESHYLSGNHSLKVSLEDFKKGAYLYSLEDKAGNIVTTKRLVVIKP